MKLTEQEKIEIEFIGKRVLAFAIFMAAVILSCLFLN